MSGGSREKCRAFDVDRLRIDMPEPRGGTTDKKTSQGVHD
jgi:hypothetical protein